MRYSLDRLPLETMLRCNECGEAVRVSDSQATCMACGCSRPVTPDGILLDPEHIGEFDPDDSGYESQTKFRYQSESYASTYLRQYKRGLRNGGSLYASLVAQRERSCIRRALTKAGNITTVLDLPAGTGKLAPVHAASDYAVVGADVSVEMLRAGLHDEWSTCPNLAALVQADVTRTGFDTDAFDCVVCLRLMHRLPMAVLKSAVAELTRVASDWFIVSNAVAWGSIAGRFGRAPKIGRAVLNAAEWRAVLEEHGDIEAEFWLLPGISRGLVTLLRVR